MNSDEIKEHVKKTARSFDEELRTARYAETHSDSLQLNRLLSFLSPREEQTFLDLGTGAGYVAMALAKRHPRCRIIGLDIAERTIRQNIENANEQALSNIQFGVFDGVIFPFMDNDFDGVVCRYAFHHFPRPETTLAEIARTVRPGGRYVLSDAVRNQCDDTDFINKFQELKQDGHVRMHLPRDLMDLVGRYGFEPADSFESSITFSRRCSEAYEELLAATPRRVKETYSVATRDEEIYLTFPILNILFLNQKQGT